MKIRLVGSEFFCAEGRMDGRTDLTKLKVAFCKFANASYNENSYSNFMFFLTVHHELTIY